MDPQDGNSYDRWTQNFRARGSAGFGTSARRGRFWESVPRSVPSPSPVPLGVDFTEKWLQFYGGTTVADAIQRCDLNPDLQRIYLPINVASTD